MSQRHIDAYGQRIRMERLAEEASNPIPDARHGGAMRQTSGCTPDTWPDGTVVSRRHSPSIVGQVVAITRGRDGKRFTRVRVTAGNDRPGCRAGDVDWHNGLWVLGAGERTSRCRACGQEYRHNRGRADFCPTCDDAPDRDRTPVSTAVPVRPPYADDSEYPF